jgi:multiple sugar transport system permease protein
MAIKYSSDPGIKQAKDNYHFKVALRSWLVFAVCVLITLICLIPIIIMILNATRESAKIMTTGISFIPGNYLLKNIHTLNTETDFSMQFSALPGYRNSLIIAGCATILTVFFSAMTSYGLTVYQYRLRSAAYAFILAVMMVPVQVTSTGFVQFMTKIGLSGSYIPLIIPAIANPAVIFFLVSYMKSNFPYSIVEAARIDGCNEFRTFVTISLPMMKPAIAVQAIFAFVQNWNNYYTQSMILMSAKAKWKTIPMMIQALMNNHQKIDYGVNYVAITLSILPIVIIYLFLSKFIIAGVSLGGVKE